MKKIKSFLLGLGLAFLILEGGLRILAYMKTRKAVTESGGRIRIMTLGNSHTFGSGTTRELSYPAQLETLLRRNAKFSGARVFNPARPNQTTSLILGELRGLLNSYRPHYVFVMAGEPNRWNLTGYEDYLARTRLADSRSRGFAFFDVFRTVKLFKLLVTPSPVSIYDRSTGDPVLNAFRWIPLVHIDVTHDIPLPREKLLRAIHDWKVYLEKKSEPEKEAFVGWLLAQAGEEEQAQHYIERSLKSGKFYFLAWHALSKFKTDSADLRIRLEKLPRRTDLRTLTDWFVFERLSEKSQTSEFFSEAFEVYPYHNKTFRSLVATLLQEEKYIQASESIGKALRINPFPSTRAYFSFYDDLLAAAKSPVTRKKIEAARDHSILEFQKNFPDEEFRFEGVGENQRAQWAIDDLNEILRVVKSFRSEVIFQNYPPERWTDKPNASNINLEIVARENQIAILDTHGMVASAFTPQTKESFYAAQLGPRENHLNEKGYALIAKQMYLHLEKVIPPVLRASR